MKNQTVSIQNKGMLAKWELDQFKTWINKKLGLKSYDSKKIVSFYDDDGDCYFTLRIPYRNEQIDNGDFDNKMLWITDILGDCYGITNCKYDGEFLQ